MTIKTYRVVLLVEVDVAPESASRVTVQAVNEAFKPSTTFHDVSDTVRDNLDNPDPEVDTNGDDLDLVEGVTVHVLEVSEE